MLLDPCVLNGKKFHWNENFKRGTVSLSQLGLPLGFLPVGRLYSESKVLVMGVTLSNVHKTHWFLLEEIRQNGELAGWVLEPCIESVQKWPHLNGWSIHILND